MSKIGRNDPCPCGSGKKYKKCCIGKIDNRITKPRDFKSYLRNNNTLELLKTFSLLQLIPKNHSKIVRLEVIQDTILNNLNINNGSISYNLLQEVIHENFEDDYREDPSESSFTENITFLNGNNIVFTGIAHEATNTNQCLLNAIFFIENELSDSFKKKVKEGTLFILHTLNEIALKLGYVRYIFEENYRERITFPSEEFIKKNKGLFFFSKKDIEQVYHKFSIEEDLIEEFTVEPKEVINHSGEETILIQKPFVKIKDDYYLVLPSAQTYSLNQFIIRTARGLNELDLLESSYDKVIRNDIEKYLRAYWDKESVGIELELDETIWQFDKNKFAYVCYLSKEAKTNIEQRANQVIKQLKEAINIKDVEFLAVHVFAPFAINEISTLGFQTIEEAKYQLPLGIFDLERIFTYWDVNSLTLWKYARARQRAEERDLQIAPFFSILTYFKWYKRNKDSFFPTDEKAPDWLSFDFGMQGEVVIECNKKNDKHFIQVIDESLGLGYVPVIKTETYGPIYTSEDIFSGQLKVAIEKYSFPIWVSCEKPFDFLGKNFVDAILLITRLCTSKEL